MLAIFLLCMLVLTVYYLVRRRYSYWEDRGVKGPRPWPFIGNAGRIMMMKEAHHDLAKRLYHEFPDEKVVGYFQGLTPALVIRDPELIKLVTIKDFDAFQDRGMRQREERFEDNLFMAEGDTWKVLRHKLSPLFSSGKLKKMMPLIDQCVSTFLQHTDRLINEGQTEQDIRELSSLLMLDINGTCAFGVAMDIYKDDKNVYRDVASRIFTHSTTLSIRRFVEILYPGFERFLHKYFNITGPLGPLRGFFLRLMDDIIGRREGQVKTRNDFIDLMVDLKEQGQVEKRGDAKVYEEVMDNDLIAAQALLFYAAGFEPSSLMMSFMLFEFALNEEIQKRAYEEVCKIVTKHGKITYDSLEDMEYLDMALDETLRKYAVALHRKTNRRYTFNDLNLTVEKDTPILIPVNGLQMDQNFFDRPDVFDPERFSPDNRGKVPPFAYMPFGVGPRHCIGTRFGRVQTLVGVATFLQSFRVFATSRTPRHQQELQIDPRFITLRIVGGIWIGIARR